MTRGCPYHVIKFGKTAQVFLPCDNNKKRTRGLDILARFFYCVCFAFLMSHDSLREIVDSFS